MIYKKRIKRLINNQKGFSLIELVVSVAIFAITMLIVTQIFKIVLDGQRRAIASQDMQEGIRYSYERMGKEIRMAQKDTVGNCAGLNKVYSTTDGNDLKFLNYHGDCVRYYLDGDRLTVSLVPVDKSSTKIGYITPASLTISNLKFSIIDNSDTLQARVTFKMHILAHLPTSIDQNLDVQTTLSSRSYGSNSSNHSVEPPVAVTTVCGEADEDSTASITCPVGEVVKSIDFASFGNSTGSCGSFVLGNCNSSQSTSAVGGLCLGKNSCSVDASNDIFGDPCYGVVKHLSFQVSCQ